MQSKPVVVWFCFPTMLKRGRASKHHSIKRNMRERKKKKGLKDDQQSDLSEHCAPGHKHGVTS